MSQREAVLFANEHFYRAFADASLADMYDAWADEQDDVSIIHPGSGSISGHGKVFEA